MRDYRTRTMYLAHCEECDKSWEERNAHGVAVQHARKYSHRVWVEKTIIYVYNAPDDDKGEKEEAT